MPRNAYRILWLLAAACNAPNEPAPLTGGLALNVSGLPDTIPADITVSGPNGYSSRVTQTQTLPELVPGSYTISVARVSTAVATFDPAFQSLPLTISATALSQATVIYSVITGSIALGVSGIPPDVPWKVHVAGPAGFRDSVSTTSTLGNLSPGVYTLAAPVVRKGVNTWAPKSLEQVVTLPASITPVAATVRFQLTSGSLSIHLNGLPAGTNAGITITGPNGYSALASGSTTLEGLDQGRYTISAPSIAAGSVQYSPSPARQGITIVAGAIGQASVNYWPSTSQSGLNLAIDALHLTQVVQNYGGAVPLVDGRDALLRVFVRATEPNVASPAVRVRFFDGPAELSAVTIPAYASGVPTTIDEGPLTTSWNYTVPAALVRPGLRVLAEVDPGNQVTESLETDNAWPSSGSPLAVDVRTVPPLAIRLVPVTQSATGLTGNVTPANAALYGDAARRLLPVNTMSVEVRQPYTSDAPALQPNDANGAWLQVLSEINALRTAEGSPAHYYGVVKVPYTAGVIGLSFLPSFAAIGWDAPHNAHSTFVHELGHHFGRVHAPGCGAGGTDAAYPYPGGAIGVFGFDPVAQLQYPPTTRDIMTYCDDRWISDYTYTGILGFRSAQAGVFATLAANAPAVDGLLVWGRIGPSGPILEPAFEVKAPASLPRFGGPHRLEFLDSSGVAIRTFSFSGEPAVDGARGSDETFAFVIPKGLLNGPLPDAMRLTSGGRIATIENKSHLDAVPVAERVGSGLIRLRWNDHPGRGLMVRDRRTGAILSFARGGRAELRSTARSLDLVVSDGVRSVQRSVIVR